MGKRFIPESELNTSAADLSPGLKIQREIQASGILVQLEKVMGILKPISSILSEKKHGYLQSFETTLKNAEASLPGLKTQLSQVSDLIESAGKFVKFYKDFSTKIETLLDRMPKENSLRPFNEINRVLLQKARNDVKLILDALQKES